MFDKLKVALVAAVTLCASQKLAGPDHRDDRSLVQIVRNEHAKSVGIILVSYELHLVDGSIRYSGQFSGSGFYVEGGWVCSNKHVLAAWEMSDTDRAAVAAGAQVVFTELFFVADNQIIALDPQTLRYSTDYDVAAMKPLKPVDLKPLEIREDGSEGEGTQAVVCGYPLGLQPVVARLPEAMKALLPFWLPRLDQVALICEWGLMSPHTTTGTIGIDTDTWIIINSDVY
jgi:hypothetical protein